MRVSLLASVIAHVAILLGALVSWGSPRTHDWHPPSVEVDIVPPEEAPPVPEPQPPQEAKQEPPAPPASAAAAPPPPPPPPSPQQAQPRPQPEAPQRQQQAGAPAPPNPTGRRDLPPVAPPKPLSEGGQPEQPQKSEQQSKLALDAKSDPAQEQAEAAARLAELINVLPDGTIARSTAPKSKELTLEEMAELKARISKCWVPPTTNGAEKPLVIIRVRFSQNGAVMGEPELIQAPPVASGPLVMRNAINAVQRCGPYNFLPREKYKDWRVLDLPFTPSGIS